MMPPHHGSSLFPYTTLFRSALRAADDVAGCEGQRHVARNRHDDGGRDPESTEIIGLHDENQPAMAGLRTTRAAQTRPPRSEEHTSELQSRSDLVCRLLLEKK